MARWLGRGMKFLVLGCFASMTFGLIPSAFAQAPDIGNLPKAPAPPNIKIPPRPNFIPPPPPKLLPGKGNSGLQAPSSVGQPVVGTASVTPKPLQWSDFRYESPQEKEFWDKVPDWTGILPSGQGSALVAQNRRDVNGNPLRAFGRKGHTGYAKQLSLPGQRTIYQVQNGWIVRSMSWNKSGQRLVQGTYKSGKLDGAWITYDNTGKEHTRVIYQAGQVVAPR